MALFSFLQRKDKDAEEIQEGIITQQDELSLGVPDDDLRAMIEQRIDTSRSVYEQAKKIMDINEAYWKGQQTDTTRLYERQPKVIENRVFMAVETVIPIIMAQRREPIVLPAQKTDESRSQARKVEQFLNWKFSEQAMDLKLETFLRHIMLYRVGVFKYRWDDEKDDFVVDVVRPQNVIFDGQATCPENNEFVAEFIDGTLAELIEKYPAKKEEIKKSYGDKFLGSQVKYVEFWTDEFVVTKLGSIILDKKKNPHWDYEVNVKKRKKGTPAQLETIAKNHFTNPKKPYVICSWFSLGKSIYGNTDLVDQVKSLQDSVNKRKRQIADSADQANGILAASGDFISKDEFSKYTGAPDERIWLQRGNPNQALVRLLPQPLGPQVFNDLLDSKGAIDNVFGTHSTTRGERGAGQETATGRQLLKESDFGRIELLVRSLNRRLEELYAGWVQMAKVFYDEEEYIKILGSEGAHEFIEFSNDDIEDGIEICVTTYLTGDKATQRAEATELVNRQLLDPVSFYEMMDMPNPKELARRLVIFQADPKLYLEEFATDDSTPGMENDPEVQARKENVKLLQGEVVQPWPQATAEHLKIHTDEMKSPNFEGKKKLVKEAFIAHVRAEMDIVRASIPAPMSAQTPVQNLPVAQ